MSERINLAWLRTLHGNPEDHDGFDPTVLELIEALQTARTATADFGQNVVVRQGEDVVTLEEYLDARFDFTDNA